MKNFFGNRLAITVGSTAAYTGARAINADVDLLKANTDYAVLGMTTDLRVGGDLPPRTGHRQPARRRARRRRRAGRDGAAAVVPQAVVAYNLPLIPIINSANKGATQIDVSATRTAARATSRSGSPSSAKRDAGTRPAVGIDERAAAVFSAKLSAGRQVGYLVSADHVSEDR
jgi:hypothetical protein